MISVDGHSEAATIPGIEYLRTIKVPSFDEWRKSLSMQDRMQKVEERVYSYAITLSGNNFDAMDFVGTSDPFLRMYAMVRKKLYAHIGQFIAAGAAVHAHDYPTPHSPQSPVQARSWSRRTR